MEKTQPWVTCHLADILLSYIRDNHGETLIDYPALFGGVEGFDRPSDPEAFLTDLNNWVPLSVLRKLELQCEQMSGRKDVAYIAAKAYFSRHRGPFPSLFEIIIQVLNDVRSAFIFANLWGTAQTNYLKLQSFEKGGAPANLYMLAQFDEKARPSLGSINLLTGFCEGFPRLYPFIEEFQGAEEISQLRIEDIVREFPEFAHDKEGDRLTIRRGATSEPVVEAARVALKTETVVSSWEFLETSPEAAVVRSRGGRMEVLTHHVDADIRGKPESALAYRVVTPGVLNHGSLAYAFRENQIFNAPYSRFHCAWRENAGLRKEVSAETIRRDVCRLLFEHLKLVKQAQTRAVQLNLEKSKLTLENLRLRQEIEREYSFAGIIAQSDKMREVFDVVRSISETDVTVLIRGETGTGKELIARAIHYSSPRRPNRFVAVNCGALPETLLESELFGHEKGAFTTALAQRKGIFETAHGGTLFLDEIGEITPSTQVKLLRVLQEGEFQRVGGSAPIKVDVRVIAATNENLEELVKNGRFRQDLYYRLHVFPIMLPPLRERTEDVPLLVSHFIEKSKEKLHRNIQGVSPQAMNLLITYAWPGNVRELENVIQRMMVVSKGEILDVADLPSEMRGAGGEAKPEPRDLKGIARESAEIIEKRAILDALSKTEGNVTRAAKALGISRATLQNKMKLYGLRHAKE